VARVNGLGQRVEYVLDALGNIVGKHAPEGQTTFEYDASGRLVLASNADAVVTFERDPVGRILAETCNGRTVGSRHDACGRRVRRRTPSGVDSEWLYTSDSRAAELRTAGQRMTFGYDAVGHEVERTLGQLRLSQAWDGNHRLLSQLLGVGPARQLQRRTSSIARTAS
jgi:YD repeat-containing protein